MYSYLCDFGYYFPGKESAGSVLVYSGQENVSTLSKSTGSSDEDPPPGESLSEETFEVEKSSIVQQSKSALFYLVSLV